MNRNRYRVIREPHTRHFMVQVSRALPTQPPRTTCPLYAPWSDHQLYGNESSAIAYAKKLHESQCHEAEIVWESP